MNLAVRVVSGVVLVAIIAAALWIGTPAVAAVVGAGALIGAWELRGLLGRMGADATRWLILPLSVWLGIRFVLPASDMAADWAFAAAAVVGLLAGLGTRAELRRLGARRRRGRLHRALPRLLGGDLPLARPGHQPPRTPAGRRSPWQAR